MTNNPLTLWVREFQRHQPDAKPAQAWRHLTTIVLPHGLFDWLIGHDAETDEVIYRPAPHSSDRRLGQDSFARQFRRAGQRA